MPRLDHNRHTERIECLLNTIADLHGQTLLHLQSTRKTLHHAGNLRQSGDRSIGDIGHVRLTEEGQNVVLAHRVELDVLDQHHMSIVLAEECRLNDLLGILVVTLCHKGHCLSHTFGSFEQTFAVGILAEQSQNLAVMDHQFADSLLVVAIFTHVDGVFHILFCG